jgi:hypothetical protein
MYPQEFLSEEVVYATMLMSDDNVTVVEEIYADDTYCIVTYCTNGGNLQQLFSTDHFTIESAGESHYPSDDSGDLLED